MKNSDSNNLRDLKPEEVHRKKLKGIGYKDEAIEDLVKKFRRNGTYGFAEAYQEALSEVELKKSINQLTKVCFEASKAAGWHTDPKTGELLERNKAEMLCLIHSEISEAMEGERKNLQDDKLPHRPMAEVELADAIIRICDYAGRWGYDLGGAIVEKIEFNKTRSDHKIENRLKGNGKKF